MVARTLELGNGLPIVAEVRAVMEHGFGVRADAVLLLNILHCEEPLRLLEHSSSALRRGGEILVIHWRPGPVTPRGPDPSLRPRPEQIGSWASEFGMESLGGAIDLPPWHYGARLRLQTASTDH